MEMTGERHIAAPRQAVWEGLNEPEVLRASIPGCETMERTEDGFSARIAVKLGPMAAKFAGRVKLENLDPPNGYTIAGEGNGGAMGFAKGGADVQLTDDGAGTILKYAVKAQVGGKMAQLGARLIDSTAKQMADQFFDRFAAHMTAANAPAAAFAAPQTDTAGQDAAIEAARQGVPVSGTDTEYLAHPNEAAPITVHGAAPRPGPAVVDNAPMVISPLRTMLLMEPFGLSLWFWGGSVIWLVILALMFL
ncbi:SRPBCC family protein [Plastoroseomonas arctica]|uniref:Carbon monoxide dehydrogenase subunit G n=1 Tax=Plastoroseomonas arctica TaxID=1509237 RepID=A0AAF1JV20_9PROT|nr:carbon monoxide dehydrogenase subunit G [Plastoroseomonas arctica]MBR0653732.1 carbon monoxide dehydrogenase subunit G [Plastoroseomonas arctica]